MPRINFVFVIHYHQPTGQFSWVTERIFENSYKLLLDVFKKYPDIKVTLHISGPLLLEMIERYPWYLDELARLHDHGTVEFLAGSIGEAVLPLLPVEDRYYQVREYLRVFEKHVGVRPRGMWLPERVWEPSLPIPLADNGIEYVFIDDTVLYRGGGGRDDALYPWLTEESGRRVGVFFIDTELRYILPWRSSGEVLAYMNSRGSDAGDRVIVWGSDAEKFGEWRDPGWARWWLNDFFNALRENKATVATVHPSEYIEQHGYRGLRYLPTGSYDKMLEWSNGFFRNFLIKYPESNNMHKKMLWVREKLREAGSALPEKAWRLYHLAQCNDAYWHGLFGGIYLAHLRQAIYENLLAAERLAEEALGSYSSRKLLIHRVDYDYDGEKEVLVETPMLDLYIDPGDGGTFFELGYKEEGYEHNYGNTVTRRAEPYLEGTGFIPDWYRRTSARIHLWRPTTQPHDWVGNTPWMDRSDAATKKHYVKIEDEEIILRAKAAHYIEGGPAAPLFIEKRIRVDPEKPGVTIRYRVVNESERDVEALIGLEHHLTPKICRHVKECGFTGYRVNGVERSMETPWSGLAEKIELVSPVSRPLVLETSRETTYWVSPIYMPARTEKGLKEIYQGLGIMPVYNVSLAPGEEFTEKVRVVVKRG